MAERSNAHDSKSCDAGMYPRVQIPFSAPKDEVLRLRLFLCFQPPKEGKSVNFAASLRLYSSMTWV